MSAKVNTARQIASVFTRMKPYQFTGELRRCELCDGSDHDVVGRRDRYGNPLRTVLCRGCGLVFTNPMPTEEEVARFYRWHYRSHYHGSSAPTRKAILKAQHGADSRFRALEPWLRPGMKILDVGSSSGEFIHVLRRHGFDATGVEPNEAFADYARNRYEVPVLVGGWQDVDVPAGSVDLIVSNHVLEHLRHPLAALRVMKTWLADGGQIHLSVPNIENSRTPFSRFHFAHLHNFNPASLRMMALKAGFEVGTGLEGTGLIMRKGSVAPEEWFVFPDNSERLAWFFKTHTNLRHFLSLTPYRRFLSRMRRLGGYTARAAFSRKDTWEQGPEIRQVDRE